MSAETLGESLLKGLKEEGLDEVRLCSILQVIPNAKHIDHELIM